MDESSATTSHACMSMAAFPTELLLNIFSYLNTKYLWKCREVCCRWKSLVEDNDLFWRRRCQVEFKDNYKAAYYKRGEGLSWFGLYRSLYLWSKIKYAAVEFQMLTCPASLAAVETCRIHNFQLLSRGELGLRYREDLVVYYDVATLQESGRDYISGQFLDYVENDDIIILLAGKYACDTDSKLQVIRKLTQPETKFYIPSVQSFFFSNNVVYFVKWENDEHIYTCNLTDDKPESNISLLLHIPGGFANMGLANGFLYVTMKDPHEIGIFNIINTPSPVRMDFKPNLTPVLIQNEHLQNRFTSLACWTWDDIYVKPRPDIQVIKVYGNLVFIGLYLHAFLIYHVPELENSLDIFHNDSTPVRAYEFKGGGEFTHIDVMERYDGHTVIVGMDYGIAIMKFTHDFTVDQTD